MMRHIELHKYNPWQSTIQELEATFVGRECIIDEILSKLKKQAHIRSNQNYLIIGPRGIGKTNMLRILQNRIHTHAELSKAYMTLHFAEEEYSIITLRDFFVKILEVLNQCCASEEINAAFETISNEPMDEIATDKTIAFLKSFAIKNKCKLVLFADNFDLIFNDQIRKKSEVKKFRDILMNENFLLIIGAAPTYFEEIMGYDRPLYNFFEIYSLDDLDENMMERLLSRRAQYDGNMDLLEKLTSYRTKLKALRHLTGGNPRLLLMLYQMMALSELPEVKSALNTLLDDLTPYYKHKLENIKSPQQRKIIDTLARLDKAATPTELARSTRIPVNQVSSLITRLQNEGYIRPARQERRKTTFYIISERIFRIWHQMRFTPVAQRRMPFLIDFISIWYSVQELKTEYGRLEKRFDTLLQEGKKQEAAAAVEHLGYLAEASPSSELKTELFDTSIQHYIELNDWEAAEKELQSELKRNIQSGDDEHTAQNYYGLGIIYGIKGQQTKDQALVILRPCCTVRGITYSYCGAQGSYHLAYQSFCFLLVRSMYIL